MTEQLPQSNEIGALVGPFLSDARVSELLRLPVDQLASRQQAGEILGLVTSDGVTVYPVWQFRWRNGRVEVKPALVPVLQTLQRFDVWTVAVLLHTPSPELDGLTPLDWLRRGNQPETVADLARVVAREWDAGAGE